MKATEARSLTKRRIPEIQREHLSHILSFYVSSAVKEGLYETTLQIGNTEDGLNRKLLLSRLKKLGYKCSIKKQEPSDDGSKNYGDGKDFLTIKW